MAFSSYIICRQELTLCQQAAPGSGFVHLHFLTSAALSVHQCEQLLPGSVDSLLDGGLREGHLTELYGEPASGKTQVLQD